MAETALPDVRKAGAWVIVWGFLLIVTGFIAILKPGIAALAFELLLGWLLIFAGIVEGIYAVQERAKEGFRFKLLTAILTLLLGVLLLFRPGLGIASIALMIGAFLFAHGISSVMLGFKLKPQQGWGWVLFDGILSIIIALLIASGWPDSSVGFMGTLIGISMMYGGVWRIMLGRALRSGEVKAGA
ncbi:MAG: DUF308 domain-containing protein [Burkholderiales bacterium]